MSISRELKINILDEHKDELYCVSYIELRDLLDVHDLCELFSVVLVL